MVSVYGKIMRGLLPCGSGAKRRPGFGAVIDVVKTAQTPSVFLHAWDPWDAWGRNEF